MKISFSAPSLPRSGPLVVGVLSGGKLLATAERLDKAADGALSRAIGLYDAECARRRAVVEVAPDTSLPAARKDLATAIEKAAFTRRDPRV